MHFYDAFEKLILHDPGNRKVKILAKHGSLKRVCKALEKSNHACFITGFSVPASLELSEDEINKLPIHQRYRPETDGPSGTISILKAMVELGLSKDGLTLVCDEWNKDVLDAGLKFYGLNNYVERISLELYPKNNDEIIQKIVSKSDVFVALEHLGPALDGKKRGMKHTELTNINADTEKIFIQANQNSQKETYCVGDGGNELGFGLTDQEFFKLHQDDLPDGIEDIACSVGSDAVVVCGVSNWGGYAINSCLHLEQNKPFNISFDKEKELLRVLNSMGCIDGMRGKPELYVDGLPFDQDHQQMISNLKKIHDQYLK